MEYGKYALALLAAIVTAIVAGTAFNKLPEYALEKAEKLGEIQADITDLQESSSSQFTRLEKQRAELDAALKRVSMANLDLIELEKTLIAQKDKTTRLNAELESLVSEVTGENGIASEEKLAALREFVSIIDGKEAGATLLKIQNDVRKIKNKKPPGSSEDCTWLPVSNPSGGHAGATQGKEWTASCPTGYYMKSYRLSTWTTAATYHHKMQCCSF